MKWFVAKINKKMMIRRACMWSMMWQVRPRARHDAFSCARSRARARLAASSPPAGLVRSGRPHQPGRGRTDGSRGDRFDRACMSLDRSDMADTPGPPHIHSRYGLDMGCRSARIYRAGLRSSARSQFCDRSLIGSSARTYTEHLRSLGVYALKHHHRPLVY